MEGLRLRQAVLENSDGLAWRVEALDESVREFRSDAAELLREDWLERYLEDLHNSLDKMGRLQRNVLQRGRAKRLADKAELAKGIRDNEMAQVRDAIRNWSNAMAVREKKAREQSIVYYRDANGEGEPRVYYTRRTAVGAAERWIGTLGYLIGGTRSRRAPVMQPRQQFLRILPRNCPLTISSSP